MRHFRTFMILIVIAVAGYGAYSYFTKRAQAEQKQEAAQAAAIATAATPKGIGALGRIEPRSRVLNISHNAGPEGAKIAQLMVDEGYDVKAGDTLAILADHPRKQAELAQVEANIKALQARLKVEKLNRDYAAKIYERRRKLIKDSAISQSELDKTEQALRQSEASLADINAQIASMEANRAVAAENLANMTITAPIDGTILRIITHTGERIDATGLLEMADLSQLDVVAEVYEQDIAAVKVDQKATITMTGSNTAYHGIVRELGFQVKGNDLNDTDPLADKDNRVVSVRITLDPEAVSALRHQLYRQVQVSILP